MTAVNLILLSSKTNTNVHCNLIIICGNQNHWLYVNKTRRPGFHMRLATGMCAHTHTHTHTQTYTHTHTHTHTYIYKVKVLRLSQVQRNL